MYTYGVLPGIFAWPAGLGDMAIGATAPLVLSGLLRRPDFAARDLENTAALPPDLAAAFHPHRGAR